MRKQPDHCYRGLGLVALLGLALLLSGCTRHVQPVATPRPTPDELAIYLMLCEKYTSPDVIVSLYDVSAGEASRMQRALQAITPPAGLEALHEQALEGYQHICQGKLLLPGANNVLRAEAYFIIEWGIGRLLDYREQLDQMRQ